MKIKKIDKVLLSFFAILLIGAGAFKFSGLIYNNTESLEEGFYRQLKINRVVVKGDLVSFCLQEDIARIAVERTYIGYGSCLPNNTTQLLKRVVAVEGDLVSIRPEGVFINHKIVPLSQYITEDPLGNKMPSSFMEDVVLKRNEFLLMGDTANSFDSRYYGVINQAQIQNFIKKVF